MAVSAWGAESSMVPCFHAGALRAACRSNEHPASDLLAAFCTVHRCIRNVPLQAGVQTSSSTTVLRLSGGRLPGVDVWVLGLRRSRHIEPDSIHSILTSMLFQHAVSGLLDTVKTRRRLVERNMMIMPGMHLMADVCADDVRLSFKLTTFYLATRACSWEPRHYSPTLSFSATGASMRALSCARRLFSGRAIAADHI